MTTNTKENHGYIIRTTLDGEFNLSTFVNVRGLDSTSWIFATTLDIKCYKSEKTAIKKGEKFLADNN